MTTSTAGDRRPDPRTLAIDALVRIDRDGAYANLLLPSLLDRSGLDERDRGFVTTLVYGTTRMQRACDWLVDRFVMRPLDPPTRAALRLGAYQIAFLGTPAHAAVSATVAAVPRRTSGLVNAVLRRVAEAPRAYPDPAIGLSYPDWIVERLSADLGREAALAALAAMNEPGEVSRRDDGYVQDRGSQLVAEAIGAAPGDRIVDLCAAPGGKATALAGAGAFVVAIDRRPARAGLVSENATRLGLGDHLPVVVADGRRPPLAPACVDKVLVDAPCTGLGALRRRPDARWRIGPDAIDRLVDVQVDLLDAATALLRPGGELTYAVCTLTVAETLAVAEATGARHPDLMPLPGPEPPWEPWGTGARLLPQTTGTDGMVLFRWRRSFLH
ncbi:MAG: transcription antitermination factor NusB [Acidimicrobiales bacterium]